MGNREQELHNREQRRIPLKQIVTRAAGGLLIIASSGISHPTLGLIAPETSYLTQSGGDTVYSSPPLILSERTSPKFTPTVALTQEIKSQKKDLFREYLAGKIYQEVLKIRELTAKEDPQYLIRTNRELNDNRINLLVLGGRAEDLLSDLVMVYSYDLPSHSSNILTIPRDVGTPEVYDVTGMEGSARINQAYGLGGMKLTKTIVENATSLSMDLAVRIDFEAFTNLVGTVGKVGIDITDDIQDEHAPTANSGVDYEPFYLKAGYYEIDGLTALTIARTRGGENNDDYVRGRRMRDIASAFLMRALMEGKKDLSYLGKLRGVLEQEIKEGRIKPDFDMGIIFPAMLGPLPIGLAGDLPGLLWTQQFGEGWKLGDIPTEYSAGLTRGNLIESANVPGVAIDRIKGQNYLTEKPLEYWSPSREFTENFLRRTDGE